MPVLGLPDYLHEQLEQSETETINDTQGPGVAVYWASDGSSVADIYFGLQLDRYNFYRNISSRHPQIKLQFSIPPDLCEDHEDIHFDPANDKIISIKVSCLSETSNKLNVAYRGGTENASTEDASTG